jgi:hypothetical protein
MNMKRTLSLLTLIALVAALGGCRSRTDRSEGSVLLSVSNFNGLPLQVDASAGGPSTIGSIVISNIVKDPAGGTSDLMSVELRSYEVRFSRRDTGTRVPPPFAQSIFGLIPAGGTTTITNLVFLQQDQLRNPPLSDLADDGVDRETGSQVVVLNVTMRFFGRTIAGDDVATDPASFTVEVVP